MKLAWVEVDEFTGISVRIFKNHKLAVEATNGLNLSNMDRGLAVSQIRRQVYERQGGVCLRCPTVLTYGSAHLHERQPKGKFVDGKSGEVSLENCEAICYKCHTQAHPEKSLMWSSQNEST